ncbi:MAG: hypothetical protein Q9195_005411 [Heterodermia aff. obscurata]
MLAHLPSSAGALQLFAGILLFTQQLTPSTSIATPPPPSSDSPALLAPRDLHNPLISKKLHAKRLDITAIVDSLSHAVNTPTVYISTIIYGAHTVTDPSVLARCTDYAHTQETFTVGNEFFGGDPSYGERKWVFIAYTVGVWDDTKGKGKGQLRYTVGWENDQRILGDYHIVSTSPAAGGLLNTDGGEEGEGGGVRLYAIAYGGKLINDAETVQRIAGYARSGAVFTVGNTLFGVDPEVGSRKYGVIAYKCGKGEEEMKYFVAWEDERRTLGKWEC